MVRDNLGVEKATLKYEICNMNHGHHYHIPMEGAGRIKTTTAKETAWVLDCGSGYPDYRWFSFTLRDACSVVRLLDFPMGKGLKT